MTSINGTLRRSVLINMVGRYSNILIQLAVMAVLARALNPEDFGLMAAVSVIAVFLSFLSEMGLGPAVIQFDGLTPFQLAGIFWLTVVIGSCAGLALALSGPAIARFYVNQVYVSVANGIALNVALSCWAIVPLALLRKRHRFQTIARTEVVAAILSGICAAYSALHGGGVGALVLKSTSNSLFIFLACFAFARPPLISPTLAKLGHVFSYSSYQFLFNLVNYFTRNLDKLLIGKYLGAIPLGLYDASYRLMLMPISNLTHVVTPAIQPVYAAHARQPDIIFRSYQKLIRILMICGGFVGVMCLGCAPEIISIGYGERWMNAIPIFAILSLSVTVQVVLSSTGSVFQALGRTELLFTTGLISAITTVVAIVAGVGIGDLETLSWLVVASFYINALQGFYILARFGFNRSIFELFHPSARTLAGVVIICFFATGLREEMTAAPESLVLRLCLKIALIGGIYFALVIVTGDAAFLRRAIASRSQRLAK